MCPPKELLTTERYELMRSKAEIELERMEAGTSNLEEVVLDPVLQVILDNDPFVEGHPYSEELLEPTSKLGS